MSTRPEHTNRLIDETSPYLLQHAHNPVDWYPWGPEALARAKAHDRLILLSIGYSACHWCHVMERESFENEAIAELMNRDFVSIKVDREERPDIDDIYMAATLAMNQGQGGWPMTVFLTPDLEPVFAGTYFPPENRYGRPGFATLLERIAQGWRENRELLARDARSLTEHLRQQKAGADSPLAVGEDELKLALGQYGEEFDPAYGGFGPAPKFPPAAGLSLLLRLHRRFGDAHALEMVEKTLDAMACGGLYDQVGGGFARYSTDEKWLVPHFEKMLYDNALLSSVYLEGFQATGNDFYRRIATETLDYILREMTSGEGGIYSATDADSEGEEGKFFVWTPDEIAGILDGDVARAFNVFYDISAEGNWEGKSIPNTPRPLEEVAGEIGESPEELRAILDAARDEVYRARLERVPPGLDDKVLTAWNGMMISALAQGYDVLGESRYLDAATAAADFVMRVLRRNDGGLFRTHRAGKSHLPGFLEDYAWMSEALVTLYESGGDARRLEEAEELAERLLADFHDVAGGGFFNTPHDHEELILRYREGTDGATPAGNAVAASALARLSFHLGRDDLRDAAVGAIKAYGRMITRFPRAFAKTLSVVDLLLEGPVELALVGRAGSEDLAALRREVARHYLPNRIQAVHEPDGDDAPPLVRGKTLLDGRAALYVCRGFACRAPVSDPADVAEALGKAGGEAVSSLAAHLPGRATAEGTRRYAERHGDGFVALGTTGLTVSRLGFGTYRVGDADPTQRQALVQALRSGVNLIDTSTNYTDGASERVVGSAVRELAGSGEVARDEVVVVSKIGYLQGRNYQLAREREAAGRPFPEMVKIEDGLWHSMHPEFLEDQLRRSLDRLELGCLDVCLLHNPEYFLAQAARDGEPIEASRDEFYRRLEAAFRYLEGAVEGGRIGAYGVSSNTVGAPVVAADGTSLARLLAAARAAGGDGHCFRVLQLPLNLFETGPLLEFNTSDPAAGDPAVPALELARQEELAVLVNRPLNAFTAGGLLRLADVEGGGEEVDFEAALARLGELEAEFRDAIGSRLAAAKADDSGHDPASAFAWSQELGALLPRLHGLEQWSQVSTQIAYMVNRAAVVFERSLGGELAERWQSFRERYFPELDRVLGEMRRQLAEKAQARTAAVSAALDPLLPAERRGATLSQKALWAVASTPGVTVVLNGMRRPEYVDDALGIAGWPDAEAVHALYQAAASVRLPD